MTDSRTLKSVCGVLAMAVAAFAQTPRPAAAPLPPDDAWDLEAPPAPPAPPATPRPPHPVRIAPMAQVQAPQAPPAPAAPVKVPAPPAPPAPPAAFPDDFDVHVDITPEMQFKIDAAVDQAERMRFELADQVKDFTISPDMQVKIDAAMEQAQRMKFEFADQSREMANAAKEAAKAMAMADKFGKFAFAPQVAMPNPTPMPVKVMNYRGMSDDRLYSSGQNSLDNRQWDQAVGYFNQVISRNSGRVDGALYWKAYALGRLGRRDEAAASLAELRKSYASSRWLDDAKALELELKQASGQTVSPEAESDEELKLMAINGLMQSDPERAFPLLEDAAEELGLAEGEAQHAVRAFHQQFAEGTGAGGTDRPRRRQSRPAGEGDQLHERAATEQQHEQRPDPFGDLRGDQRYGGEARHPAGLRQHARQGPPAAGREDREDAGTPRVRHRRAGRQPGHAGTVAVVPDRDDVGGQDPIAALHVLQQQFRQAAGSGEDRKRPQGTRRCDARAGLAAGRRQQRRAGLAVQRGDRAADQAEHSGRPVLAAQCQGPGGHRPRGEGHQAEAANCGTTFQHEVEGSQRLSRGAPEEMRLSLWLMAAALPLAAQPKLLVNAQLDKRSAAAGLEQTFRPMVTAQPQPAWIAYSVPSTRVGLGCDYVRDGWSQPGVIHLEPPDHAVILFRVDNGAVERIRTLSPDCEIDAGNLPLHWLEDVKPAESVALLDTFATQRERFMDGAMTAIASHGDPAADAALQRFLAPNQPESIRLRVVSWYGGTRGRRGFDVLKGLIANDPSDRVRERAISTLGNSKEPEALDLLIATARKDPNSRMRMQAISALNRHSGAKVLATLKDAIESDPDVQVKRRAVSSLQSMPDGEGIPLLIQLARATRDNDVRKQAMSSLGNSRDGRALTFFEEVLKK